MKMRTTPLWISLLCLTACGSGDDRNDGESALVALSEESPGDDCENGGTRVDAGRDADGDGTLDESEVEETSYVCSGADAKGARGEQGSRGPQGERGPRGADGADGREGPQGEQGPEGLPGAPGDDGAGALSLLLAFSDESEGENCKAGGQKVETGLDTDEDGTLDASEVTDTAYICNGSDGGTGANPVAGFRLVSKFVAPTGPIAEIVDASPDGNTLVYTSSSTGTIGFADITQPESPTLLGTVDVSRVTAGPGEPTSVAFAKDGAYVVVAVKDTTDPLAENAGAVVVVDVATRAVLGHVAVGVGPDSIALTPDGSRAVVAIEDEEDEDGNEAAQARTGSVQIITLNYDDVASSAVSSVDLGTPSVGNMPTDLQPEYVDVTQDGATAIVSLQENNLVAVIDLASGTLSHMIDMGTTVHHRADVSDDGVFDLSVELEGQLQPDAVCLLPDGKHFISANEGDTPHGVFGGVYAGGRGFSIFSLDGERVYDSGDAAELLAFRAGAYPDGRSDARGIEPEGCGVGVFGGTPYAFVTGERNASLYILDVSRPSAPVFSQIMGAPTRPEAVVAIDARNLIVVAGEGDAIGGGIWLYQAVTQADEVGHGSHVYDARSTGTSFGALSGTAYQASTGNILAVPDNAYLSARIWSFAVNHTQRRLDLIDEILLKDATGVALQGIDPEGIVENPEGGFIVATEGTAANGGNGATCQGLPSSNRILFFDASGTLDSSHGIDGPVDLPCAAEQNAFDWDTMGSNGFEGVSVLDTLPEASGGLVVYTAFQRPLAGEEPYTRIGAYDVDSATWNFYFYELDADIGGDSGRTFLSELTHVTGDTFAVIERDQGTSYAAQNKTVRTFSLSSGTVNDRNNPVNKQTAIDLLADSFRFDQEKLEGLALGGGSLFVVNDNDGGEAHNFFVRFSSQTLLGSVQPEEVPDMVVPNQADIVINEINSESANGSDFIELYNAGDATVDVSGWKFYDADPTHLLHVIPDGTTMGPGTFLVLDSVLAFGLGGGDSVIMYNPYGVELAHHSWLDHASTNSRCPNGTGDFQVDTLATRGTENSCL